MDNVADITQAVFDAVRAVNHFLCDDEDVEGQLAGQGLSASMVRHALVALGSDRLDVRPYERDGELVRVEIFGIEE